MAFKNIKYKHIYFDFGLIIQSIILRSPSTYFHAKKIQKKKRKENVGCPNCSLKSFDFDGIFFLINDTAHPVPMANMPATHGSVMTPDQLVQRLRQFLKSTF